jgi:uncharacterized protein (DUF885 family)
MARRYRIIAMLGISMVAFNAPATAADPGADLNNVLRYYRDAEQKIRPDAALHRNDDGSQTYDETGALKAADAERRAIQEARSRLDRIDFPGLKPQDKLSYEIFRWALDDEDRELQPAIAEIPGLLPLNQFDGEQIAFPRRVQWRDEYPWKRAQDYDAAIKRILNFGRWTDGAIARMREGVRRGVVQPRAIIEREIAQVEMFATADDADSFFMQPVNKIPPEIPEKDRARVSDAYRAAVRDELLPAYRRLATFLKTEYLPHARQSAGLCGIPGGKELYRYLVKSQTTSDLSPDEIHALGLTELSRIENQMEQAKRDSGFAGSLDAFRHYLQTDPKFKFKDAAAMLTEFNRVRNTVNAHLSEVFSSAPSIPLSFRFYENFAAPDKPAAEYTPGSADGKRPGTVYLNGWDLPERPTYTSEVLELHEGIPGHHLQVSLAMQNNTLPRFRRFGHETAFVEGWALYAETLGPDFGLYEDPYQKFGALSFDAWRASRLVVDTGIHWLNWSREQAIQFLTAHTALSRTEAEEEVDRYIVMPAQALSYKIGEREILDLRQRAQAALGDKFDLKRFHDAVLKDGAMPLPILDRKISRWIALEKNA